MTDQIREHITDIYQLAEEMALTAEGVPGMNLTLSRARIASVCRALLALTPTEGHCLLQVPQQTPERPSPCAMAGHCIGALPSVPPEALHIEAEAGKYPTIFDFAYQRREGGDRNDPR